MVLSVYNVLEAYIFTGQKYCVLCMKTSKETRLVNPVYIKKFAKALVVDFAPILAVCYMCEAFCRTSVMMCEAMETGVKINNVMIDMRRDKIKNPQFAVDVRKYNREVFTEEVCKLREATTYKFTQTLCVDSNLGELVLAPISPTPPQGNNSPESILPHWHPDLEPEIIELDDEDTPSQTENTVILNKNFNQESKGTSTEPLLNFAKPLPIEPQLKPQAVIYPRNNPRQTPKLVTMDIFIATKDEAVATVWPENKILVRIPTDTENCIVHNIVTLNNRNFVPTLSCEIVNNELQYYVDTDKYIPTLHFDISEPEAKTSESVPKEGSSSNVDNILHKALVNFDKKRNIQYLGTKKRPRVQLIQNTDDVNPIAIISSVTSGSEIVISDDEQVNSDVQVKSDVHENSDVQINSNDVRVYSGDVPPNSEYHMTAPVPMAIQKAKIDWEDKIPMDVITLLDPKVDSKMLCAPSTYMGKRANTH